MTTLVQLYDYLATPEYWQDRPLPEDSLACAGCGETTHFVWSPLHIPALPPEWRHCWTWNPQPPAATSQLRCPACTHPDVVPNDQYPF